MKLFASCLVSLLALAMPARVDPPTPLTAQGHPVAWWFAFKFNGASFPQCVTGATRVCSFGGRVVHYIEFGPQFAYASNEDGTLTRGVDCAGDTAANPIGATFDKVYNRTYRYLV